MENLSIAIVSGDRDYGKALTRSLLSVCERMIVKLFDSREFIHSWSSYRGSESYCAGFDLILWAGSEISDAYGDNIVYLAEKPSMVRRDFAQRKFCLYKYSSAQSMISSIFEIYSFLTGRKASFSYRRDVALVAFASCRGGCGCSTLARAFAQEMSQFDDKRVLYVSMEEVESTIDFMNFPAGIKSVGEYLYRLFKECGGNLPFLESYVARDCYGVESFAPTNGRNPLVALNRKDMQKFIISLIESGRYALIVLDLSVVANEAVMAAAEMASKICFVTGSAGEDLREEQYVSYLLSSGDKKILEKIIRVVNLRSKSAIQRLNSFKGSKSSVTRHMLVHPMVRTSVDIHGEISLEGQFGEDINSLATQLMEQ